MVLFSQMDEGRDRIEVEKFMGFPVGQVAEASSRRFRPPSGLGL